MQNNKKKQKHANDVPVMIKEYAVLITLFYIVNHTEEAIPPYAIETTTVGVA